MSTLRRAAAGTLLTTAVAFSSLVAPTQPAAVAQADDAPSATTDSPAGPALDPDDPGVDATRLVAVPAADLSEAEITAQVEAALAASGETAQVNVTQTPGDVAPVVEITTASAAASAAVAEALGEAPGYEAVEYGFTPVPLYSNNPDDPLFRNAQQWGLGGFPGAGFDGVWASLSEAGAANVAPIADIDTGFLLTHAERCPNIVGKWDFGDGDSDVTPTPMDADGATYHGTATAGLIGACTDNAYGIAAAAWDQTVYVYKVSDTVQKTMTDTAMINAIRGAVDDGARVINMSIGFVGTVMPTSLRQAVDYAIDHGVVVVASAGNYGTTKINGVINPLVFPAAYEPVISVAATDINGAWASFSTFNSQVDIAAPGAAIMVLNQGSWGIEDGTSFAAPAVAAAAGILLRFNPSLTPAEVEDLLTSTATDVEAAGKDNYTGYGVLNAHAAAIKANAIPPAPEPDPISFTYEQLVLSPDLDGDGRGEIIGVAWDGTLRSYPVKAGGVPGAAVELGSGFASITVYAPGDWDRDGNADLMARDGSGKLYLFAGDGNGYVENGVEVGHGWSSLEVVPAGDLTGDGNNDILAIDPAGDLFLYAGNGAGGFKNPYPKVGHGWHGLNLYAAGDLNGDSKNDILMINPKGQLFAYAGRGNGTFGAATLVGHGWQGNTLAAGADLNGDGLADIIGRTAKATLNFYAGKGGGRFAAAKQVSKSGW